MVPPPPEEGIGLGADAMLKSYRLPERLPLRLIPAFIGESIGIEPPLPMCFIFDLPLRFMLFPCFT